MEQMQKAKEFYLRGFNSHYIRRRTGICLQDLKKQYPEIDKQMIINYQITYIQDRYTTDEISEALKQKLAFPNVRNQIKQRNMMLLGCGFGPYSKVFSTLLGTNVLSAIEKECEERRQAAPAVSGREARRLTMLERYGCEGPNGDPEIAERMLHTLRETNQSRYGVDYPMQRKEVADLGVKHRQETMTQRYGAPNSVQVESIREKIITNRVNNGTLTSSRCEDALYEKLVSKYGVQNVLRNYLDEDRYPFRVDFYIPSEDLFIELNADASHQGHWFDSSSETDCARKAEILKRAKEIDAARKPATKAAKSRYWNFLRVWTELDVQKRNAAKKHHLKYLVFWDGYMIRKKGQEPIPRLKDVNEWFDAGCPLPKDWRPEHTW